MIYCFPELARAIDFRINCNCYFFSIDFEISINNDERHEHKNRNLINNNWNWCFDKMSSINKDEYFCCFFICFSFTDSLYVCVLVCGARVFDFVQLIEINFDWIYRKKNCLQSHTIRIYMHILCVYICVVVNKVMTKWQIAQIYTIYIYMFRPPSRSKRFT